MLFNTTFNNISVISLQSILLVEETGRKLPTCRKSKIYTAMKKELAASQSLLSLMGLLFGNG
jgi:hypothetical protein